MAPEQIQAFRIKHCLTAKQLAKRLPVPVGTLRGWEEGRFKAPSYLWRTFAHLAEELEKDSK